MKKIVITLLCICIVGCGTVPSVRPIGTGEKSVTLSSGGPVTEIYDITMPIPYSVLRYRQGINDNTDFHLGIHTTMAILGNLGVDFGLTKQITEQSGWKPSFAVEGSIYGFYHFNEFSSIRAYPEISFIGSYNIWDNRIMYFGVQNMIQFTEPYIVTAPFIGFELPFGNHFILNLETKWYGPSEESEDRVVDYNYKPFGYGALGFVWGASYKF